MSVTLLPGIGKLDPGSLCYSIYSQLYHNFFNAQDKKDEAHPYGISEGDETSIRLRNTAYNFAEAISGAVAGDGSGSGTVGILTGYLKKSGGDMTGMLRAGYGFEAGIGNVPVLNLFSENITDTDGSLLYTNYGVDISGDLRIGSGSLIIGGRQFIRYDARGDTATIESTQVDFGHSLQDSHALMGLGLSFMAGGQQGKSTDNQTMSFYIPAYLPIIIIFVKRSDDINRFSIGVSRRGEL